MTRAAIYARYSSDQQREASIEDQLRLCRGAAPRARAGTVAESTPTARISGASLLRPGYPGAAGGRAWPARFDVVLAEALDRLSPRPGGHRRPLQAAELRRRAAAHPRRGRDQRAACRPQGHDERALPQGPGPEDPARAGGPRRGRAAPAAASATATTSCGLGDRRRASTRRAPHQRGRGGGRAADLRGVRRRRVAARRSPLR